MEAFAKKLAAAIEEVAAAEHALAVLLRQIRVAPRAEKTTISSTVEEALSRLNLARRDLVDLQKVARAERE